MPKFWSKITGGAGDEHYIIDPGAEPSGVQGTTAWSGDLVPVDEMYGNMMVLKDGSYRMIMQVGSVNFDLKGPREQMALLVTFGEALNSLSVDFPLQVLLHAAHLDTQAYVRRYAQRLADPQLSPQMRRVIQGHIEYFESQARSNHLLDRSFFMVVPFFPPKQALGPADARIADDMPGGGAVRAIMDRPGKEKRQPVSRRELEVARVNIMNRASSLASQLARLGISAHLLDELATVRLLRELYNPGISDRQKLRSVEDMGDLISVRVREDAGRAQAAAMMLPRPARAEEQVMARQQAGAPPSAPQLPGTTSDRTRGGAR